MEDYKKIYEEIEIIKSKIFAIEEKLKSIEIKNRNKIYNDILIGLKKCQTLRQHYNNLANFSHTDDGVLNELVNRVCSKLQTEPYFNKSETVPLEKATRPQELVLLIKYCLQKISQV